MKKTASNIASLRVTGRRSLGRRLAWGAALAIWSVVAVGDARAAEIRLLGNGTRVVYDGAGAINRGYTNAFEAYLGQDEWRIRVTFGKNTNYFEEYGYDGHEYRGAFLQAPSDLDPLAKDNTNATWLGFVDKASGSAASYPITAASSELKFLWLALASSGFIDTDRSHRMVAPWVPRSVPGAQSFVYEAARLQQAHGLPRSVRFHASAALWKKEAGMRAAGPRERFPYPEGFVAGEYDAIRTTNVSGTSVPLEFGMDRFAPARDPHARASRFLVERYRATVTSVATVHGQDFSPEVMRVAKGAVIYDFRFADRRYPELAITWRAVSGHWPSADRPEIPDMVRKARLQADTLARMSWLSRATKRTLALVTMAILLAAPFGFVWWRSRKLGIQVQTN